MAKILDVLILQIIPFFVSVVLHEISHGLVAYLLGDDTAKKAGRFKLHTHFDLYGSFLIPLFLYIAHSPFLMGYAKPVPIDVRKFKDPELDMALVALGGPLCNAFLALLATFILKDYEIHSQFAVQFFFNFVAINLALCLFNLIPIPPLDGSRILTMLLPTRIAKYMHAMEPYGIFLLIGVEIICSQISRLLGYRVGILATLESILRKIIGLVF